MAVTETCTAASARRRRPCLRCSCRRRHRSSSLLASLLSAAAASARTRRCARALPSRVRARRRRRRRRVAADLACGVGDVVATERPCCVRRCSRSPCRRQVAAARRSSRRRSRALLAPARSDAAFRDGSALGRRSTRRLSPPALNAARLLRRVSLRGHTLVAATARRPPAVDSLMLAARRGDARAHCSRPLGRPPLLRRLDTRPPLDAAVVASCAERSTTLAPCFSARSHVRGRDDSAAERRRVDLARRSPRRRSRALLAPARSAAAFATARHSAAARRGGLRLLRRSHRVSCTVLFCTVTRP